MAAKKTTTKAKAKPKAAPKAATKAAAKAAPARKATAVKEPMTKTQILTEIAENTELSKKEVQSVLDELAHVMERHIKKRAIGQFTLPGLLKVQVVRKPATKARKGINPFNGEETVFKAKPARNVVKIRPLKKLKDMVV
ncbi:MAG: integration host factor [Gammaproteobacteria bacterium]|nr:MAG: integration host factor [Gammaproteobacteria bacterium]